MPSLFVIQGRDQGRRFELRERVLGVGRDPSNRIRLTDTEVSRRHAELHRCEDGYHWQDLGSSNGSFVNSARVDRQPLRSGDRVQVGSTLMIFTDSSDSHPAEARQDVDIVGPTGGELLGSQIVQVVSQDEGSQLLNATESDRQASPWLARARRNLQIMYRTSLAVSHTMDIDQLLQRIMELIFEWVEADRGCIMLVDRETDQWVPKVRRDRQRRDAAERMTISRTILDYVRSHHEGVLTSNAREDDRWESAASILKFGVREAICVPMQGRYGVVGAIYIDTFTPPGATLHTTTAPHFSDEHLKLMVAIGHQAALAVEDTSYYSAMVQAERLAAMGQTIAGLSHHIKNILQGIRGGSYLIQEGLKAQDWEVTQKGWSIVEKNQDRISSLVLDMLTFSKEREPEMVPSDLNQVVGDVLELMATRAAEFGVELIDARQPDIPLMTFDPDGLHRAILNIVTNAIDAAASGEGRIIEGRDADAADEYPSGASEAGSSEAGSSSSTFEGSKVGRRETAPASQSVEPPRVEVSTAYLEDLSRLQVCIRDNGVGIPDDQQQRIFNAFVSSKGQRGTGLGLPVSQKIMEEHGGRVTVESGAGEGSCFTLELPAIPAASATATNFLKP